MRPAELEERLLKGIRKHLKEWLPEGYIEGNNYISETIVVDLSSGKWEDAPTKMSGKDLISLYAYLGKSGWSYNSAAFSLMRRYYLAKQAKKRKVIKKRIAEPVKMVRGGDFI